MLFTPLLMPCPYPATLLPSLFPLSYPHACLARKPPHPSLPPPLHYPPPPPRWRLHCCTLRTPLARLHSCPAHTQLLHFSNAVGSSWPQKYHNFDKVAPLSCLKSIPCIPYNISRTHAICISSLCTSLHILMLPAG